MEFQERLKMPFTVWKYLHWFQRFKFEKCVKCASERTDDVILSTQYNIKYINGAISVILQLRPLKLMVG